jgi:hypothetical protein
MINLQSMTFARAAKASLCVFPTIYSDVQGAIFAFPFFNLAINKIVIRIHGSYVRRKCLILHILYLTVLIDTLTLFS